MVEFLLSNFAIGVLIPAEKSILKIETPTRKPLNRKKKNMEKEEEGLRGAKVHEKHIK